MKEIKDLTNEIYLKDAPGYEEAAEMYFSIKNIDTETDEVDENRTNLTVLNLVRPLVENATPVQMMMLETAAKHQRQSILLAKIRFEL